MFGQGISREGDILDLAVNHSIIQKSGAWFAYNSTKIGQGRENAKQYLRELPYIQTDGGIKLQRPPAGGGLRTSEHYAHFLSELIDENNNTVGLADNSRQLAERLGHQSAGIRCCPRERKKRRLRKQRSLQPSRRNRQPRSKSRVRKRSRRRRPGNRRNRPESRKRSLCRSRKGRTAA